MQLPISRLATVSAVIFQHSTSTDHIPRAVSRTSRVTVLLALRPALD